MFSCILVNGKIAAATESWWSLHPHEIRLLLFLAVTENKDISKDIPVFLPYKSPTVSILTYVPICIITFIFIGLGGISFYSLQPNLRYSGLLFMWINACSFGH